MHTTVEVLKEIRKRYPDKKILLFWDGAGWHHGSKVRELIEYNRRIDVVYFPRYSLEENPQEYVWEAGRTKVMHNKFIPDIEKAENDFVYCLNEDVFEYKLLGFSARSQFESYIP